VKENNLLAKAEKYAPTLSLKKSFVVRFDSGH